MTNDQKIIGLSAVTALFVSLAVVGIGQSLQNRKDAAPATGGNIEKEMQKGERTMPDENDIISTVKYAEPAVVSVIVAKDLPVVEQYFESPFQDNPFFEEFLGPLGLQIPQYRENGTERREIGGGTAFFIGSDGFLMTNRHVVADQDADYTVLLNDGRKIDAEVLARDSGNDIAILKVEGADFPALSFSEEEVELGQSVIAIGNALGEFRNTVSVGVVSGLSRSITAGDAGGTVETLRSVIQTDAAINRGNSGGPLLNRKGEVVGMNSAIAMGAQNIGFAIPASELKDTLENFRKFGRILRPFIGVRYMAVTKELQEKNSLPYDYGALIARGQDQSELAVTPGSPADQVGLEENDIILEIDGEKLTPDYTVSDAIRSRSPGEIIELKVFHEKEEIMLNLTLGERE